MKKLYFEIQIKATPQKLWLVLWDKLTYGKWTSAFTEGSYAVSDWKQGSKVQFLSPDGGGLFSVIDECRPNEYMAFKHIGEIQNFIELPVVEGPDSWSGSMETYSLKENNDGVLLKCTLDATEEMEKYFSTLFPKAMSIAKELAENPIDITIETTILAPIDIVWKYFNLPEHVTKWNAANDDWHTTHAFNDLKPGGKFSYRMEAKDNSFGFDFSGTYNSIQKNEAISYTLDDGRNVNLAFSNEENSTKIIEIFEAENEYSFEIQQTGWQMILNNFKKYTESN